MQVALTGHADSTKHAGCQDRYQRYGKPSLAVDGLRRGARWAEDGHPSHSPAYIHIAICICYVLYAVQIGSKSI
jgi:hypothetical protein